MRVSHKLSLAIGVTTLLGVGTAGMRSGAIELQRFEADVRRDQLAMGVVIARAIEHVVLHEGTERARALVAELNGREPDVDIAWLEDVRPPTTEAPTSEVRRLTVEPELVSFVPVAPTALGASTLRLTGTLRGEEAVADAARTTALLVALLAALASMVVSWGLSTVLVARPLRSLGILARRLGGGDLTARSRIHGRDEVSVLAGEMNVMGTQLERAQLELEEASAARVAVLEQLRHADRLRVLGEIASEFAHQIGTPLAAVRTRAQMLELGDVPPPSTSKLGRAIVEDVDRVSGAVRQLLDFARRRSGARESLDMRRWADRALDVLRPLAARRRIALELRTPDVPVEATFTSIEMQQVLTNLVMNAMQASEPGGRIVVTVGAEGGAPRLEVEDRGAGIAPDVLPQIFEPYFTTKPTGEGTGLGLSVAHGIVREHGGTIEVTSVEGAGTTVVVKLPQGLPRERLTGDGKASWKARVGEATAR